MTAQRRSLEPQDNRSIFTWWGSFECPHADPLAPEYITGLSGMINKNGVIAKQKKNAC